MATVFQSAMSKKWGHLAKPLLIKINHCVQGEIKGIILSWTDPLWRDYKTEIIMAFDALAGWKFGSLQSSPVQDIFKKPAGVPYYIQESFCFLLESVKSGLCGSWLS